MAAYVYTVFSEPVPGQEAEYNRWYEQQHLDDVLRVPGFVSARRYQLSGDPADAPAGYLATYDIDTDDLDATLAKLHGCAGTPEMPLTPALDVARVKAYVYRAIGAPHRA